MQQQKKCLDTSSPLWNGLEGCNWSLMKRPIFGILGEHNVYKTLLLTFVGEKLREFSDRHGVATNIFDLFSDKESILIPSYQEYAVHRYKLNYN